MNLIAVSVPEGQQIASLPACKWYVTVGSKWWAYTHHHAMTDESTARRIAERLCIHPELCDAIYSNDGFILRTNDVEYNFDEVGDLIS